MMMSSALSRSAALLKGPIARGSIIGLIVRLGGLALMFLQAVIAARILGAQGFGVVTLLLAIAQIAASVVLMGYGSFAVAEIARGARPGAFIKHGAKRIIALSLIVLPIAFGIASFFLNGLELHIGLPLLLSIPVLAGIQLLRGVTLGLGRAFWGVAPGELIRPALLVASLIIAAIFAHADSAAFIALYLITAMIALGFACFGIGSFGGSGEKPVSTTAQFNQDQWDRAALPFLGIHLASILQVELATLMLGFFAGPEAVGLFQPIARISMLLMLPTYALSLAFNPRISKLYNDGDMAKIGALAHKHTRAASALVALGGVAIGLFAPWILWLFGHEFTGAAPLVWLLVAGRIVLAACGPGAEILAMTGHSTRALKCLVASLSIEAVLGAILIPDYGLWGAAIALGIGLGVRGILLAIACSKALNIGLVQFWRAPGKLSPSP